MKSYLFIVVAVVGFVSCKNKKKQEGKNFISVVSIIRKQVAEVDTSLYSIVRIDSTDSLHVDTTYIPREKFAEAAKDFLEIPDLSDPKVAKRYIEEPAINDESLNRVIINYTALDPEKEEFKKQELLVTPVMGGDAKINNIIVFREISNKDSFVSKQMLWQVDKSFQVVTVSQKAGKPELTVTTRVTWNEDKDQ